MFLNITQLKGNRNGDPL